MINSSPIAHIPRLRFTGHGKCLNENDALLPFLFPLFFLQAVDKADFKVGVEIDSTVHQVYVLKRPHVDEFLRKMADIYECVLFTASLSKVRARVLMHCFLTFDKSLYTPRNASIGKCSW